MSYEAKLEWAVGAKSSAVPCSVEARDNIASACLKRLYSISERIDLLSLNLRDKTNPICRAEVDAAKTPTSQPEEQYPDYFTEIRQVIYQLQRTADRLESIYDRCEI